jgi:hypothetical protein
MPVEHMSVSTWCFGSAVTGRIQITYTTLVSHLSDIPWMNLCCMIPRRQICRNQHLHCDQAILCLWLISIERVANVLVLRISLKDRLSNKSFNL